MFRKAGVHGKMGKARRAQEKHQQRRVAQSVSEHPAFTRGVVSSILTAPTIGFHAGAHITGAHPHERQ
jgi:hypothetical protein